MQQLTHLTLWNNNYFLNIGLGTWIFGMPHILLRFMAIEDKNKIKLSRRIASVWVVIAMAVAIFIGVIGHTMSQVGVIDNLKDSKQLLFRLQMF